MLSRLHHHRVAGSQRRGQLPRLHQHGVVPGNDLPYYSDRLMPGVAKEVPIDGNCLALNLVGPACKIAIAGNGLSDIDSLGNRKRLAVVECFQPGQFVCVRFDQISQTVQQSPALGCAHLTPGPCKRRPCRFHCLIHIGRIGLGYLADFVPSGRIDGGEGFARFTGNPAIVDEQPVHPWGDFDFRGIGQSRNHKR